MDRLSPADLASYVESWQWEGKAGGFGYQDRLGWVKVIEGSESNVVGLPMELLAEMLASYSLAHKTGASLRKANHRATESTENGGSNLNRRNAGSEPHHTFNSISPSPCTL